MFISIYNPFPHDLGVVPDFRAMQSEAAPMTLYSCDVVVLQFAKHGFTKADSIIQYF